VTGDWSDILVVGSGIAGSALATVLARRGIATTVLEQQQEYRDRVRGEYVAVWGVAELQRMGLADALFATGGCVVKWRVPYDEAWSAETAVASARDNSRILKSVSGAYCGSPGTRPEVHYRKDGLERHVRCRLVVGADGRRSVVREQAGIALHHAAATHLITGLLVDDVAEWPQNTSASGTYGDVMFLVFPQGAARLRLYLCTALDQRERFAGREGTRRFPEVFGRLRCLPGAAAVAASRPIGPCATFLSNDTWTESPLATSVALIGDAAGYNDPIIGQGLASALRDARILADLLVDRPEWDANGLAPDSAERRERMRRLRFTASLVAALQTDFSPWAMERRAQFYQRVRAGEEPALRTALAATSAGPETVPQAILTYDIRTSIFGAPAALSL